MPAERSGPAVSDSSGNMGGKGEMIKAPDDLQDLRRKIYAKAKAEPHWRFWGLYVHVCKRETLRAAYEMAKSNDGAPGVALLVNLDKMLGLERETFTAQAAWVNRC